MFRANVASVFFDQSYLKKKYTYIILNEYIYIHFPCRYISEKNWQKTRFYARYSNSPDM